jgi:two-component system cell cycle response regulator CpdR
VKAGGHCDCLGGKGDQFNNFNAQHTRPQAKKKIKIQRLGDGKSPIEQKARSERAMIDILLAEDDDAMRQYLTRALERAGYCVVAVDRGTDALAHIMSGEAFDLLLTDIVMPEMDGIELAQRVARLQPAIRIMFITGFSAVSLRAGATVPQAKILSKPFHLKELVSQVRQVLSHEAASTEGG